MKKALTVLLTFLMAISPLSMRANTIFDYQNYNHDYCPNCQCAPCKCSGAVNSPCSRGTCPPTPRCEPVPQPVPPIPPAAVPPCGACAAPAAPCAPCKAPCAPACGTTCGLSVCTIGVVVAALVAAAVIIVSSGNGSDPHSH